MRKSTQILILSGLGLVGLGLIAWGWIREGAHGYLPGLLANLGTALLLGVLFLVLQSITSRKIGEVRSDTQQLGAGLGDVQAELERTTERLDELTSATHSRIQAQRDQQDTELAGLADDVSFERVSGRLARGDELGALSHRGVRVTLPNTGYRLRWQDKQITPAGATQSEPIVQIVLEDRGGTPQQVVVAWSPDQPFSQVMADLAAGMTTQRINPGDAAMDATAIVTELRATLSVALDASVGAGGTRQLSQVVELVNQHWALTDHGIEHLGRPSATITPRELHDPQRRNEMREFSWIAPHVDEFGQAWDLGAEYHKKSNPTTAVGWWPMRCTRPACGR